MRQMLLLLFFFFFFTFLCSSVTKLNAQQRYSGNSALDCNIQQDGKDQSSAFLYTCNGQASCQAFLIFRSQPPYSSIHAISNLTSSDPSEIARFNNFPISANFPTNQEVIVPVICSRSGQYYQTNTSYAIRSDYETYFLIANDTYEGLSTCSSLAEENGYAAFDLQSGMKLRVPLRCACPTGNQTTKGIKYLLTYSVYWGDDVSQLSERFNTSSKSLLDANELTELDPTIHPFTTILIPLQREPSSSHTKLHPQYSAVSPLPTFHGKIEKSVHTHYLGVGIGVGGFFLILMVFCINCSYKLLTANGLKHSGHVVSEDLLSDIAQIGKILKVFSIEQLEGATNNFSSHCNIAGSVYRGVVDGNVIAIKTAVTNVKEEVNILNKTNHFNLISLCGLCVHHGNCFLIYEYMENGTLRNWLSNNTSSSSHGSWNQRVQIALDVASGLHYLHKFIKPSYVHKNVNSKSVLLNGSLRAKIANFGMARPTGKKEEGFPSTIRFAGTVGYMAPEYLKTGLVTPKLDVYAFGVVLLELLTRRSVIIKTERGEQFLSMAVASSSDGENEAGKLMDWIDPLLISNQMEPMLTMLKLSTACLRQDPGRRPSMDEVVSTLLAILVGSEKCQTSYVGSV